MKQRIITGALLILLLVSLLLLPGCVPFCFPPDGTSLFSVCPSVFSPV